MSLVKELMKLVEKCLGSLRADPYAKARVRIEAEYGQMTPRTLSGLLGNKIVAMQTEADDGKRAVVGAKARARPGQILAGLRKQQDGSSCWVQFLKDFVEQYLQP